MNETLAAALEYIERGWSVIPILPETKKPAVKWREFAERAPTEAEATEWWTRWPHALVAVVTGAVSGIVVVDTDSETAAAFANQNGLVSPIQVKTRHGRHHYFEHPRDGEWRGPRVGSNSTGIDWPKLPGLDFRGDGSYALLPPSKGYSWDIAPGFGEDELPVWDGWSPGDAPSTDDFSELDLSSAPLFSAERETEWERTAALVEINGKLPSGMGNARNDRVARHAGDCAKRGVFGEALHEAVCEFMDTFFVERLPEREWKATCRSIETAERRNHPDRVADAVASAKASELLPPAPEEPKPLRLIRMADAPDVLAQAGTDTLIIEPWLPKASICQVYGYSGHGKSLVVQHAMAACAAGAAAFGPFAIRRAARVLYFDWENGRLTIAKRLMEFHSAHGPAGDNLQIWAPFLDEASEINLRSNIGKQKFTEIIKQVQPEIVVIDTARSAFPGLEEKDAKDWSDLNQLLLRLRNFGLTVIYIHHSNKPDSEGNLGREAGSSNQLTPIETQVRVAQVFEEKDVATHKGGIWDGSYMTPVWPQLRSKVKPGYRLYMVVEWRYGKVREWTDLHEQVQWIGLASGPSAYDRQIVSTLSPRERARFLYTQGNPITLIADAMKRPQATIEEWLRAS